MSHKFLFVLSFLKQNFNILKVDLYLGWQCAVMCKSRQSYGAKIFVMYYILFIKKIVHTKANMHR